jgi:hypothetical protein
MMHLNEIADIDAIEGNRSSSIAAAAILLNAMMQGFKGQRSSMMNYFPDYLLSNKIKLF